ncbi:MAG: filamentous hemagglutinin N-terminal domain-containing protein [Limisphaerales bacterium]
MKKQDYSVGLRSAGVLSFVAPFGAKGVSPAAFGVPPKAFGNVQDLPYVDSFSFTDQSAGCRLERPSPPSLFQPRRIKRPRSQLADACSKVLLASSLIFAAGSSYANPQGLTVVSGSAHSTQHGNTLQISTSQNAFLNWNSFNIAPGETTIFHQPSATSIVFNNINNANPTTIYGSLQANGIVVLENQSGFYFGPNAFVKAAGLVVTTAAVNSVSAGGGPEWSFDGPPTETPIVNYGHLETAAGGSLFLIGKEIENNGTVLAPGGTAALVAGQEVLLSERPNGLSLAAPVKLPAGSVDNKGQIVADAGQVLLQAQTVNNSGLIQANSVRQENGVIELYASKDVQLTGSSLIQANGAADGVSPGGNITIKSGGTFSDSPGSQISATGGASGGNGGNVEVSAPNVLSLYSSINAGALAGWSEGVFLMDPVNIVLGNFSSGSTSAGANGVISATGSSGPDVDVDVRSAFQNINANILLQASGNITLNSGTTWNLSTSTGKTTGQLTLQAGGDITLNSGSMIEDPNNWSITLQAGYNSAAGGGIISGTGNLTLTGACAISTAAGNINVVAGNSVTVGSGGIVSGIANGQLMTGTGGNISVQALSGNVNCGSSTSGYLFTAAGVGYTVNPALGGISTASGGNVTIQAGGNISAILPSGQVLSDAGSGAFGAAPGNVTLTAGGSVVGHYVVADGSGTITAANAGISASQSIALSLVKGGWAVTAADNIFLQEVRNPNGMFNNSQLNGTRSPTQFLYNYDPLASVALNAGNGVTITGSSLPRDPGDNEALIFPPILSIEAGAGGITLKNSSINLFPSPEGSLVLTTTRGGNLTSTVGSSTINISDSQSVSWTSSKSFTSIDPAPANDLLHLNDPNPVLIDISGSISDFTLYSPKPVEMYVAGNMIDSTASIENLRPTDTTTISAGGQILDHSSYVILTLPPGEPPNFNALASVEDPYLNAITLLPVLTPENLAVIPNPNYNPTFNGITFSYDAASRSLLYSGIMSSALKSALLSMTTPFVSAAAIQQIYAQSQQEATRLLGSYTVAGPGTFRVNAASIDLGNGGGLVSAGIAGYPGLAPYTARGADLDVTTSGNLTMLSSSIESEYGGTINVSCGGEIDVGSALVPSSSEQRPLGIDSLWGGNINVVAGGDVNVDGSRIAAYDGGNVFVESLRGNVNAGTGGSGSVLVSKPYLTKNGQVQELNDVIPGSGILATSYPQLAPGETAGQVGDITVLTPEGNIVAARGGISQLALGPVAHNGATINLVAGSPSFVGNVDASGSGIVGGQVNISATGNIEGLVVASLGANINAQQNVSATVLSQGAATVSAGGTVSGTVVGVGSVSVSGASDVAAAFSATSVSASGTQSGAAVAAAPTGSSSAAAAATTQQVTQSTQSNSDLAANSNADDNDPLKKKKKAQLMEYVGRVTVLLPE